ncbi:Golgi-associated plant pathogenesis-related protein 1-like isoform X2 [Oculina patagonica]
MLILFITTFFLIPNFKVEAALPFKDQCVKWHNVFRIKHQAGPVTWDNNLAKGAEDWAKYLANNNLFQHAPNRNAGENLYMSSYRPQEPCTSATKAFYGEVKYYDFNKPGYSSSTGHFTQVVWKNTKQIGAAQATRRDGRQVVVIRYYPPGNYIGATSFRKNVLPILEETTTTTITTTTGNATATNTTTEEVPSLSGGGPGQICCCLACKILVLFLNMKFLILIY